MSIRGCLRFLSIRNGDMTTQLERNTNYDFLRFIGISCVILAHMGAPDIIFQLRNFDVPLLVLLSGMSFTQFSFKHFVSYKEYLYNRLLRLIVPTWIFLIFYNLAIYCYSGEIPESKNIILQLALIGGTDVGVWIVRIFFSMSIIAPFLCRINNSIEKCSTFFFVTVAAFIIYEFFTVSSISIFDDKFYEIIFFCILSTVAYGIIYFYGLRMETLSKKELQYCIVMSFLVFLIYLIFNYFKYQTFIETQVYKNPPRLYYISYSLFVSFVIVYIVKYCDWFNFIKNSEIVKFIGRSTLWIYLWHWFLIKVYNFLGVNYGVLVKYLTIFAASALLVYLQSYVVFLLNRKIGNNKNNKFVIMFTG